jgi:galactokinase
MMGGGFGGCTLNIVKKDAVENFIEQQALDYSKQFNIKLDCYVVQLSNSVQVVKK